MSIRNVFWDTGLCITFVELSMAHAGQLKTLKVDVSFPEGPIYVKREPRAQALEGAAHAGVAGEEQEGAAAGDFNQLEDALAGGGEEAGGRGSLRSGAMRRAWRRVHSVYTS